MLLSPAITVSRGPSWGEESLLSRLVEGDGRATEGRAERTGLVLYVSLSHMCLDGY